MPTTIDSMTGIVIKSPFFDVSSSLELFPAHPSVLKNPNAPQKNRVALMYGPNGSGKSTIAQGFREYAESTTPRTVDLSPAVGTAVIKMSSGMKAEKFFVFDEKYISKNIKVQESGLGTIVLFGKQIELEKQLEELEMQISQTQIDIDSKNELIKQYNSANNVIAPEYWQSLIIRKLQAAGGWAETSGIRIKKNQIKTCVTDAEVDRLGKLSSRRDEAATKIEFDELFSAFNSIDASASPITLPIQATDLMTAYKQLNDILEKLENKRVSFNEVITNRRTTEKELLKLNDEIAHYTIDTEYQSLLLQRTAKQTAEEELDQLLQTRKDLINEQQLLDAQRKDLQIAVEEINRSLSYIFYSDSRLKLYLESDQVYHLKVNGKAVSPDKISCGERNALALSYFFAEIAKETEFKKLYYDEMLLVIDDPVSSF